MKKSIMFTMGAMLLMMAGTVMMSCSNDDEVVNPEQQKVEEEAAARGSETQLPDASAFIREITDTGYILSYGDEGVQSSKSSATSFLGLAEASFYEACARGVRPAVTVVTLTGITCYFDCNALIYRAVILFPLYNAHKC